MKFLFVEPKRLGILLGVARDDSSVCMFKGYKICRFHRVFVSFRSFLFLYLKTSSSQAGVAAISYSNHSTAHSSFILYCFVFHTFYCISITLCIDLCFVFILLHISDVSFNMCCFVSFPIVCWLVVCLCVFISIAYIFITVFRIHSIDACRQPNP